MDQYPLYNCEQHVANQKHVGLNKNGGMWCGGIYNRGEKTEYVQRIRQTELALKRTSLSFENF